MVAQRIKDLARLSQEIELIFNNQYLKKSCLLHDKKFESIIVKQFIF